MKSVREKVVEYVRKRGRGIFVFPSDFAGEGNTGTIKSVLNQLAKDSFLMRLGYGIYYFPKIDGQIGPLYPSLDEVAHAIARKDQVTITPTSDTALNILGLSQQVPINVVYFTSGRSKQIKIGNNKITFKQASAKRSAAGKSYMGLIIRSLEGIGQQRLTPQDLEEIEQRMSLASDKQILGAAKKAPNWIANIFSEYVRKRYVRLVEATSQKEN